MSFHLHSGLINQNVADKHFIIFKVKHDKIDSTNRI